MRKDVQELNVMYKIHVNNIPNVPRMDNSDNNRCTRIDRDV